MKQPKKITRTAGNILIVFSLLLLTYIYYPLIGLYFFPPKDTFTPTSSLAIVIPKIHAWAPIIKNVDAWNKDEYAEKLKMGVAHAKGTPLPGEKGVSLLFAHSSDFPWNITRNNIAFFKLNQLKKGDNLFVFENGKRKEFVVEKTEEVYPKEIEFLNDKNNTYLVLQTCTPIGTDWKRLLVFAKPI